MADEKGKALEKQPENQKPTASTNDELSEKDLDRASGGGFDSYMQIGGTKGEGQ